MHTSLTMLYSILNFLVALVLLYCALRAFKQCTRLQYIADCRLSDVKRLQQKLQQIHNGKDAYTVQYTWHQTDWDESPNCYLLPKYMEDEFVAEASKIGTYDTEESSEFYKKWYPYLITQGTEIYGTVVRPLTNRSNFGTL